MFPSPCPDRILDWDWETDKLIDFKDCVAAGKPARLSVPQCAKRPTMKHTYERAFYGLQASWFTFLLTVTRHTTFN
jgi:hypothetical protein